MRSNLPDFSSQHSHLIASKSYLRWSPPMVVGGLCVQDRNDHQPPGSSCVSDTVLFSHDTRFIRVVYSFA